MQRMAGTSFGALQIAALALVLATSAGLAHAQSYPDTIFVFYADGQVPYNDVVRALGPATPYIPAIMVYEVPALDLEYVLEWLAANSTISLDDAPLDRAPDNGDFVLSYGPNPNSDYEVSAAEIMQEWGLLEHEVEWLNENFRLPHDVDVVARECNEENAFYFPHNTTVVICYEFVDYLFDMWLRYNVDDHVGADNFAYDVTTETLYHEMGHAILDIYNLPFTGREENVVDQFAALVLSYTYDENDHNVGQDMMYNVGLNYMYAALDDASDPDRDIPYWGVHGLNEQRSYNILCYAYGADPVYNAALVDDLLPTDRARDCADEYGQIESAFSHLLAYYTNGFFD